MNLKNSSLNILSFFILNLSSLIVAFIVPKLVIEGYGSEINGLLISVNSIMGCFVLFESGVGTASIQALYKPLVFNKKNEINIIMNTITIFYNKISRIIMLLIILLSIIYPLIIFQKNYLFVFLFVLFTGIPVYIDFRIYSKYKILLTADSKLYVINMINILGVVTISFIKIYVLMNKYNIIFIQAFLFIVSLLKSFLVVNYINKNYKFLNLVKNIPNDSLKKRNDALIYNLSYIIFSNIDLLILTLSKNLVLVSVYGIYKMIYKNISFIITIISNGLNSDLGKLYHKNLEEFKKKFKFFEKYNYIMIFSVYLTTFKLFDTFINLYLSEGKEFNYLIQGLSLNFMIAEILNRLKDLSKKVIFYSGTFKETVKDSFIEIILNIFFSIILFFKYGIKGLLIGTIIALVYRVINLNFYINNKILKRDNYIIFIQLGINFILLFIIYQIDISNFLDIKTYIDFIKKGGVIFLSIFIMFFTLNIFFEILIVILKKIIGRRI